MSQWYLIYTKPRNEDRVAANLGEAGFEILNPKIKERKFIRRKISEVLTPLFPCYVFVRFRLPRDYRLVRYTRGVKKIVGTDHRPTPVHNEIIDSLRERMKDSVVELVRKRFNPGDDVVIKGGPFKGLEAVFLEEMSGMERVSILLREINARVVVDGAMLTRP